MLCSAQYLKKLCEECRNSVSPCLHAFELFFKKKEAIISVCNCCCDNQYGCAKRFLNKHTPLSLSFFLSLFLFVRAATAHLPFGLGLYCLTFFYLPSLFPPPLPPVFCAPVSADLVPSRPNACLPACLPTCLPACQRVQKAAKIKKKAVCNKRNKKKDPLATLLPLSPFMFLLHICLSVYPLPFVSQTLECSCTEFSKSVSGLSLSFCLRKKKSVSVSAEIL